MRIRMLFLVLLLAGFDQHSLLAQQQTQSQDQQASEQEPPKWKVPPEILAAQQDLQQSAAEIFKLTNDFRYAQGLPEVKTEPKLKATTDYFANYMATNYKYGHKVDGKKPSERVEKHGYDFCLVSENIAYLYSSVPLSPQEVARRFVEGWEKSPEHRKNMLDPDMVDLGVAVTQSQKTGYYFAVQNFGRPKSMRIEFVLVNRSSTTIKYESGDREMELPPGYSRTHYVCRPSEVQLYTLNDQEPEKKQLVDKFKPVNKATYTITAKAGKLSLQKEPD